MRSRSSRHQRYLFEAHAKRQGWRNMAVVGVSDHEMVRHLLAGFRVCKVLAVGHHRDGLDPRPAAQQRTAFDLMRKWARGNPRFRFVDGLDSALPDPDEVFDGVLLLCPQDRLADVGRAWVRRVRPGGWLLGLDHRLPVVRRLLDGSGLAWDRWGEGVWAMRVVPGAVHDAVDAGAIEDETVVQGSAPVVVEAEAEPETVAPEVVRPLAKRRGRPPGSRNKPRSVAAKPRGKRSSA